MGDIERVLSGLQLDAGFAARVVETPVEALDGFALTVADLERVASALRPRTSDLDRDDQRRLLGGLLFLMTRAGTGLASAPVSEIRAEITANVWQVRTKVGQHVDAGDELVILESMKMEIPVLSPLAGTVTEIRVQPDDQIKEGDVVAVIDSDAP